MMKFVKKYIPSLDFAIGVVVIVGLASVFGISRMTENTINKLKAKARL